ncbi:MAG: T9SS type A sorting domain-containing protein [Bacteroidetes bacterium]|nr:T9SS type A sorting domain-containing protein [Bacteroidota bacterium]
MFLNLNFDSWNDPKIYLIDALGRIFEREINSGNSVNIHNFANGSYLLKVKDQTHEKSFKIIIAH